MSSFGNENLFDSGPHQFTVGGLSLRHRLDEAHGSDGATLDHGGRSYRSITQEGLLIADDVGSLHLLMDAIESRIDGQTQTLVDERNQQWEHVALLAFEPGKPERLGSRWSVSYQAQYAQVQP